MPTWDQLTEISPWLAALAGIIAVIVLVATKVLPVLRKFSRFLDDVLGAPARPGVEREPSLIERVASIEAVVVGSPPRPGVAGQPGLDARVAHIEHEVTTNHGSSLKDAVKDIGQRLTDHVAESEPIKQQIADLHKRYTKE